MAESFILRLAIPSPLFSFFDYLPPENCAHRALVPGVRLRVPFGRGERCGVLLETDTRSSVPENRLKRALELLDERALMSEGELALLKWAADYYQHPPGEVILGALPARLRNGGRSERPGRLCWRLTSSGERIDPTDLARAPRQAEVMRALVGAPSGMPQDELIGKLGNCRAVLTNLERKGWLQRERRPEYKQPAETKNLAIGTAHKLNAAQQVAVDAVARSLSSFTVFLLDGVTGSGKTEVYLRLIELVAAAGRQALLLVPEIGLTPQLVGRLTRRLSLPTAVLHSGLTDRERERAWHSSRLGEARVLLGTRSAIFAPLPELGLIVVDEEHDLSFKQQEGFRYSARDMAIVRGQRLGLPVVLGSATPSLESLRNVQMSRYRRLTLPERAGTAAPPRLDLLDIRSVKLQTGVSHTLLRMIREVVEEGNQVLLLLNRRGYAPLLTCHDCGWIAECRRCDAKMTYHLEGRELWCHHCGSRHRISHRCPTCGGVDLRALGQGTERLQQTLEKWFPEAAIARIDRDSTRRKGALESMITEIRKGAYSLLLGTQMLAKGHHFPDVTLVGVLDVDQGLFGADYRAAERMGQLIVQVAGRAGRAEKPGRVVIQTRHPDHPLLQTLLRGGYAAFSAGLIAERAAAELPPFTYQALLRAEAAQEEPPLRFLEEAQALAGQLATAGVQLWGPVPAPMERRAGRHRAHLLLQASERGRLHRLLPTWVAALQALKSARRVRWSIDVDPQELL